MKILYIHQFFKTPYEGGGTRSWYLAQHLVEMNENVYLISSHNSKKGIEKWDGLTVHYVTIPYDNSFGFFKRLWVYGYYVLKVRNILRKLKTQFDVAYVMTTPLTTGFIALWIKKKLKIPYIFEVGDLWPDVPIEMGVIKNSLLKRWLYKKEKSFYDNAQKVMALSPDIKKNIESKTNTSVSFVPNLSDTEFFQPNFRTLPISQENPLQILYFGSHGRANHLEFVLEAARVSLHIPIQITLMGQGSEKKRIQHLASSLPNVFFEDHKSMEHVKEKLENSDAILVSFQYLKTLHTGCPNKFFDGLAAGKMIISNLTGWTAQLIQEKEIGFSYCPLNPEEFVQNIEPFLAWDTLRKAQQNARKLSYDFAKKKWKPLFYSQILESVSS